MDHALLWENLTWKELRELVNKYLVVALLPTGSVEQHGPHLPLGTDHLIAYKISLILSNYFNKNFSKTNIRLIVLPPIPYGYSIMWSAYPGTITIDTDTLRLLVRDVIKSVHSSGVKHVLVVNAHAGNSEILKVALREVVEALNDLSAYLITIWDVIGDIINEIMQTKFFHADETETSLALALNMRVLSPIPEGERITRFYDDYWHSLDLTRRPKAYVFRKESNKMIGLGAFGNPRLGSKDKGNVLLNNLIKRLSNFIIKVISQ